MDRLRAIVLVYAAQVERQRLRERIGILERKVMAGEIREAMAKLRAAKAAMIDDMLCQIDSVHAQIKATHDDGREAMKLPMAELEQTQAEIREIRAEFAPKSNGGPKGPLPGADDILGQLSTALEADSSEKKSLT